MLALVGMRSYRYVGPASIAEHARSEPGGHVIASVADLDRAVRSVGGARGRATTFTFTVRLDGALLVADRSSEHVACASGAPVLAAGELVARDGRVESATNLSTGYCPEPSCWSALAAALDHAGIVRPAGFACAFEMRRCESCAARNIVKDGVLECAECGADLPIHWNFDDERA